MPPKPIYLLPTLLTLGNLLCGLFATAAAAGVLTPFGYFPNAAEWLIVAAIGFDGVDGLVARRLDLGGRFGVHLDSLADMVSFGVAPSILIATTFGMPAFLAWMSASLYCCCVALRLAKFTSEPAAPHFSGLPSPFAALVIAGLALAFAQGIRSDVQMATALILPAVLSGMMLNRSPFPRPANAGAGRLGAGLLLLVAGYFALAFCVGFERAGVRVVLLVSTVYAVWGLCFAFKAAVGARRRS